MWTEVYLTACSQSKLLLDIAAKAPVASVVAQQRLNALVSGGGHDRGQIHASVKPLGKEKPKPAKEPDEDELEWGFNAWAGEESGGVTFRLDW